MGWLTPTWLPNRSSLPAEFLYLAIDVVVVGRTTLGGDGCPFDERLNDDLTALILEHCEDGPGGSCLGSLVAKGLLTNADGLLVKVGVLGMLTSVIR